MKTVRLSCRCGARLLHVDEAWRADESAEEFRRVHVREGCAVEEASPTGRNAGRKGRPLGPYRTGPRGGVHVCRLSPEQQEDDRVSEALSALAESPNAPAWMDEPLPLGDAAEQS